MSALSTHPKPALEQWSAIECAQHVRAGSISAEAVAQYFIARVQQINPEINALVGFDAQWVMSNAVAIDARLQQGENLPLAGVPVTIKDNLWVEGRVITQGSRLFADFVAPEDAWCVQRLKTLGALILGITNCSEFACKGVTDNLVYGATAHPMDTSLTPGGSSGGAAAALAAGLGLLALGTDAGGSVRRPAAHCGLVGYKPSAGLISHSAGFREPNHGTSVIGILAHSVSDCAWALDYLSGFDAADACAPALIVDWQINAATRCSPPTSQRIAWSPQLGCDFPIDADVLAQLQSRIQLLRASGWTVNEAAPEWAEFVAAYPIDLLQHSALHALYASHYAHRSTDIDTVLAAQINAGANVSPAELARAITLRERLVTAMHAFFSHYDLLLCPTAPVTAWQRAQIGPTHIGGRRVNTRGHAAFTPLFNLAGLPACSVPAGTVRGLPVGLQVVGRKFEDARVLQMAALLQTLDLH